MMNLHPEPTTTSARGPGAIDRLMLWLIALILIASPWPFGSRLPWAAMLGASVVVVAGFFWFAARLWENRAPTVSSLHGAIALFLLWVIAQRTFGWTVYPHGTAYDGTLLLSYAIVFAAVCDLAQSRAAASRFHFLVIGIGIAVGVFGLLQYFGWNGKLFWIFDPPYGGSTFGPFNNRNYFAGYLVATIPVAVSALVTGSVRRHRVVVLYGAWLGSLALLLSLSRGGWISFAVAALAALLIGVRSNSAQGHGRSYSAARGDAPERAFAKTPLRITAVALVALGVGLLWLQQTDRVFVRLETMLHFQSDGSLSQRIGFWKEALAMIGDRPITGFGLGSYLWVFPNYRTVASSLVETNAHNEYLEMAAETGLVGAGICLVFLALLFRVAVRRLHASADDEEFGIHLGALCAWIGICVYAVSDFPTVIPAIDYALAVLAGLAVSEIGPPGT